MQLLTDRKHGQPLEALGHGFYRTVVKQSLQKLQKLSKNSVRPKDGRTIAPPHIQIRHCTAFIVQQHALGHLLCLWLFCNLLNIIQLSIKLYGMDLETDWYSVLVVVSAPKLTLNAHSILAATIRQPTETGRNSSEWSLWNTYDTEWDCIHCIGKRILN